jgi:hypothetical protein
MATTRMRPGTVSTRTGTTHSVRSNLVRVSGVSDLSGSLPATSLATTYGAIDAPVAPPEGVEGPLVVDAIPASDAPADGDGVAAVGPGSRVACGVGLGLDRNVDVARGLGVGSDGETGVEPRLGAGFGVGVGRGEAVGRGVAAAVIETLKESVSMPAVQLAWSRDSAGHEYVPCVVPVTRTWNVTTSPSPLRTSLSVTACTCTIVEPEGPVVGASAVQLCDGWTESTPTEPIAKAAGAWRRMQPIELPPAVFVAVNLIVVSAPAATDEGVLAMVQPPLAPEAPPGLTLANTTAAAKVTARRPARPPPRADNRQPFRMSKTVRDLPPRAQRPVDCRGFSTPSESAAPSSRPDRSSSIRNWA